MSNEEKSFIEWMKTVIIKNSDISIIRKAYLDGFAAGYHHKKIYNAQELLQK